MKQIGNQGRWSGGAVDWSMYTEELSKVDRKLKTIDEEQSNISRYREEMKQLNGKYSLRIRNIGRVLTDEKWKTSLTKRVAGSPQYILMIVLVVLTLGRAGSTV